jgi:hypothetical protein
MTSSVDVRIATRISELIEMGEKVLQTKREPDPGRFAFDSFVDSEKAIQWFTSAQSILSRGLGSDSAHYKNFSAIAGKALTFSPVRRGQGILKAALEDLQHGHLFDIRRIIAAEVSADFLEQAAELHSASYYGPAALVAGCVLEDCLRRLCGKHELALPARPKLDTMNADLARAGVYNKLTQKRITAIADIRNNAAHGHWDQFDQADVKDMIDWVENFVEAQEI